MTDILTNNVYDLVIDNGDLVIGYSDNQHQDLLLVSQKGAFKEQPTVGVGIENFLNDGDIDAMLREIRQQFEGDGMKVSELDFDENTGKLLHDANYEN